jgi:small nuclear ribonucleoprotein (snRNP)-like protein
MATTPSDFLKLIIGQPVLVRLNSGVDYRGMQLLLPAATTRCCQVPYRQLTLIDIGKLACLDGFMNIALESTEEYVNGQVRLIACKP